MTTGLFGTFQDRLVKEMRLRGISTIEEGKRFLKGYLSVYNKRFSVRPICNEDLHRPISREINLDKILCIRTIRTVRNDSTIAHDRKLYQIEEPTIGNKVTVEERINGKMLIACQGKPLRYRQIAQRPQAQVTKRVTSEKSGNRIIPGGAST